MGQTPTHAECPHPWTWGKLRKGLAAHTLYPRLPPHPLPGEQGILNRGLKILRQAFTPSQHHITPQLLTVSIREKGLF